MSVCLIKMIRTLVWRIWGNGLGVVFTFIFFYLRGGVFFRKNIKSTFSFLFCFLLLIIHVQFNGFVNLLVFWRYYCLDSRCALRNVDQGVNPPPSPWDEGSHNYPWLRIEVRLNWLCIIYRVSQKKTWEFSDELDFVFGMH